MKPKIILTILFAVLVSTSQFGQSQDFRVDTLLKKASQSINEKDYAVALNYLIEAKYIADKNEQFENQVIIHFNLGDFYRRLSNYGEALHHFMRSWEITQLHPEKIQRKSIILCNIGILHHLMGESDKALAYFQQAYTMAKADQSTYSQVLVAVNMADLYNDLDDLKKGEEILFEVESLPKTGPLAHMWNINYAENLFLKGEVEQARRLIEKILPQTVMERDCYVCVLDLLGRIYATEGKFDEAIAYIEKGLETNEELKDRVDLFSQLSAMYKQKNNYVLALRYKDSVVVTQDSLAEAINRHLFAVNKVRMGIEEYQNKLKINHEKQKTERIIYISIVVFAIVIFFTTYRALKNRFIKQKQEKALIESKHKVMELKVEKEKQRHRIKENQAKLKQELLKNKVSQKNRELSATALYHSGRNEILEKIITSLADMPDISKNKAIVNYIKELKSHMKADMDWKNFTEHFEKVNPGFLKNLKAKHPELTKRDIRFLCYFYMNLGTKEICTIFNITPEAFRKRKQRLSEKMEIESGKLYDYILTLA